MIANEQNKSGSEITVGLDIGTTKLCALVAANDYSTKTLKILGFGIIESEGLNRGVVVNIDRTVKSIKAAVQQAEQQSGIKIEEVVVGIAGDHIESFQTSGIVGISNPTREISKSDVDRLLEDTRNFAIPADRTILHIIPQEFIIDGQDGIHDPVGISGVRMEAKVHIVTGLTTAITNIHRCVERAGLRVKKIVLEPLASSQAILTPEEKEVGVALIDIGGGTTDIAIFEEDIIRYTAVFGVAGKQVTDDIRKVLGIVASQAERIKREYGHCFEDSIMKDEIIMIPGIAGRKPMEISKRQLCRIIQPRMEEIFEFALAEIRKSGYEHKLGAGVVITGGNSLIRGADELASAVFGMPVKIGYPSGMTYTGLATEVESPVYSTAVGLALLGLDGSGTYVETIDHSILENRINQVSTAQEAEKTAKEQNEETDSKDSINKSEKKEKTEKSSVFKKIKNFFEEL
ncbi:MAG TPA: cell division protein FtsA [Candidatus Kapabacteria bacterium]|nr:cell division protein FtsA [Candidatus Kapabacteria bacterium]